MKPDSLLRLIIVLLLVVNLGLLLDKIFFDEPVVVVEGDFTRKYFNDELIVSGQDDKGELIALSLRLSRVQQDNAKYNHDYELDFYYDGEHKRNSKSFITDFARVDPDAVFFDSFENENFEDLSTRENFEFQMDLDGAKLSVKANDFVGDFLTKNTLEYTRYSSVGSVDLVVDGREFNLDAAFEKAYSADLSKYVYFEGFSDLNVNVDQFIFWDDDGAFYLIDNSKVFSEHENYTDHSWVLYKDADGGAYKLFDVDVEFTAGKESVWKIYIPGLDTVVSMSTDQLLNRERNMGPIEGDIGEKAIHGFFVHRWDNKNKF